MNILITGANGFIGRQLISCLSNEHNIFAIMRQSQINPMIYEQINIDLLSRNFENKLPDRIHCVVHLAQSNGYRDFPNSASDMFNVNVNSTFRLLEWAREKKINNFILASTANVYKTTMDNINESYLTQAESFYGATKISAEKIAIQYQKYFQIDILRLFTIYGPGQKKMLFPTIVERIKKSEEIELAKGIGVYLTPLYINDLTNIIKKIITLNCTKDFRLINVCGDDVISLKEIVIQLQSLMQKKAKIKFTNAKPQSFIGSNVKLKKLINNINFTHIKKGLSNLINYNED